MATRRSYSGNAPATTLSGAIPNNSALTFSVASATGFPAGGASGPFFIVVDRGLSAEEKMLIDSIAGTTFTVNASGRGMEGTVAQSHNSGAIVEHVLTKTDIDEANAHLTLTAQDDHTQYLNVARHDLVVRHPIANLPTGTSGTTVALGNHVHASLLAFGQPGTLVVTTGKARMIFPTAATIVDVRTAVNTAPTGATLIVDVKKNGSTIFTTTANRPTIAASANASGAAIPDITAFATGDYMTVDIAQVGATIAGADLTTVVRYTLP